MNLLAFFEKNFLPKFLQSKPVMPHNNDHGWILGGLAQQNQVGPPPHLDLAPMLDALDDWDGPLQPPGNQPFPGIMRDDESAEMKLSGTKISQIIPYKEVKPQNFNLDGAIERFKALLAIGGIRAPEGVKLPEIHDRSGDVMVGIEIELENFQPKAPNAALANMVNEAWGIVNEGWIGHNDPSLRNHGYEFISRVGLQAKDVPKALHLLNLYLHYFYPKSVLNYRCGTHVHLNVRDFTVEQLINFVMLYVLFEGTLYHVSGDRYKNIFCVPIRASGSRVEQLFKLLHYKRPTFQQFRSMFMHYKKYMALNLLPIGTHGGNPGDISPNALGTVEFRHHKGASKTTTLCSWLQILLDLHYAAQQHSFDNLKETLFGLNTFSNYLQFTGQVFVSLPQGITNDELVKDMYEGSAFIKELYLESKGE